MLLILSLSRATKFIYVPYSALRILLLPKDNKFGFRTAEDLCLQTHNSNILSIENHIHKFPVGKQSHRTSGLRKSRGLKMHPCVRPVLVSKQFEIPYHNLTAGAAASHRSFIAFKILFETPELDNL
ncbi:hypothetical protein J6590_088025 [Homalodisca vitripennis]|nr:hypothetical protein J6590_088025 [Homalodisca vitripennis]